MNKRYEDEELGKKKKIEEKQNKNLKQLEDFIKDDEKEKKVIGHGRKKSLIEMEPIVQNIPNMPNGNDPQIYCK